MLVVALLLAVLVGLALGLLGGGGSILTMPILLYVLGMDEKTAIPLSLLVVGFTSMVGVVSHHRAGNVDWRIAPWFAGAGAAGAFVGGLGAAAVPGKWLLAGFIAMMFGTAFAMIRGRKETEATGTFSVPKAVATGLLLGGVTGLVGAGGGFVVVPALVLVGRLPMRRAVGTSLVVIAVQTLAGFVGHAAHATIPYAVGAGMGAAAGIGAVVGGGVACRVPAGALKRGFGWFVLGMAMYMGGRLFG